MAREEFLPLGVFLGFFAKYVFPELEELERIFILAWNTEFHIFCHNSVVFLIKYSLTLRVANNNCVNVVLSTIGSYY